MRAKKGIRQRPTLPPSFPGSTIGAEKLNFRVRNENGCLLLALATENLYLYCEGNHLTLIKINQVAFPLYLDYVSREKSNAISYKADSAVAVPAITGCLSYIKNDNRTGFLFHCIYSCESLRKNMVKPHGLLVSVSSMHCCTSTPDLSTL